MAQELTDRIRLIMQEFNLSSSAFADEIGVQRPAMSHILSGRNRPSLDVVMKILKAFDKINSQWLLTGEGKMKQLNLFGEEAREKPTENTENQTIKPKERLESSVANQPVLPTDTAHSQGTQNFEERKFVPHENPVDPKQTTSNPIYTENSPPSYLKPPSPQPQTPTIPKEEPRNFKPEAGQVTGQAPVPNQEHGQDTGSMAAALFGGSSGKKIEKIVVLYSDKTFSVYNPE